MIIQRYILREIAATFIGVALLLSLVVLSITFIRVMSSVVEGDYPASIAMLMLFLQSSANLIYVFPLMFFLSVLLALGRLYRDSEMTVMHACAFGPELVFRTVGLVSLLMALLFGSLALFFIPWSNEQDTRLQDEVRARTEVEGLTAGRFNSVGAGMLVYLEKISDDRREMLKVFAYGESADGTQVLSAESARQQLIDGERYMVFFDGYRYEGDPAAPDFRIIQFREHGVRIQVREVVASERPRQAMSSLALWRSSSAAHMSELQWRLMVPISTLLFGLLAVPLSRSSPREGRYARLFEAILIYIVYSQLMFSAKSALGKGTLNPWPGLWWVHALALALLLWLLWRQQHLPGSRRRKVAA
ncbi:MAG: LPS export ABC transporter permease LptF [Thiohalomonadaceae bacterium]